jgi:uncharacterized protein (UPF0264 family)
MDDMAIAGRPVERSFPGLLVSVRNEMEAEIALRGGADWIDVKEPKRGALGPADPETIRLVLETVAGRAPVSVAVGEFQELRSGRLLEPIVQADIAAWKLGLAQCGSDPNWARRWHTLIDGYCSQTPPVAVVYADWKFADAPCPREILNEAIVAQSPALLIDTYFKSQGTLFDVWPEDDLARFIDEVRVAKLPLVLAGSLRGEGIRRAAQLGPDLVAVRGAACLGGRSGRLCATRVAQICRLIRVNDSSSG